LIEPLRGELVTLGIESILLIPLLTKGHVMGLFSLGSIGTQRAFQPDEIDVIQTVAAQVAISLENTQLIEDLHLQSQMLARMASDVTAERRKLDAVLRNLADGLLVTDATGHTVLYNRAFLAMFGLEGQELRGRLITAVIPEAPLQHLVTLTCQGSVTRTQDFSLLDGRAIQVAAAPVSESNEELRVVMVLRDVTNERQLKQMKSDFISTVSHELRTPLTPVMGFAKLIRKSFDRHIVPLIPAEHREGQRAVLRIDRNLGILTGEVEHLSVLVEDVLFLADLDAGRLNWQMREVDLKAILEQEIDLLRPQAQAKGLEVRSSLPDAVAWVYGDAERLTRTVKNLLSNALKFTEKGWISVEAQVIRRVDGRWEPEPRVTVSEEPGESVWVLVAVSDTGPGIAIDKQRTLFERFGQGSPDLLTDKPEGTGLGLAISKEIIQYHGGRIWVESKVGGGSTFAFLMPFSPFQEGHNLPVEEVSLPESAPLILVVDDEPGMRSLLHHILLCVGYHVRFAQDGPTALNMVRSNKPDLILLDIMLPGISGLDVISVIRADEGTRDVPIVVISAISVMDKAIKLGADAYFAKPIDQDALLQTIGELLSS
jgi:PAS domain S-box-containing protein